MSNDLNLNDLEQEKIVKDVIEFVEANKEKLEENYAKAKRTNRKNYIKTITMEEYIKELPKVSVVILTANEFEENILNYCAYNEQENPTDNPVLGVNEKIRFKNEKIEFEGYILKIGTYHVLHLHAKNTGSYTTGGSADLVRYIAENEYIYPKCIISFGICFGHSCDKQTLGDVIIAEALYPYFIGVKLNDGTFSVKSDEFIMRVKDNNKPLYDKLEKMEKNGEFDIENENQIENNVLFGNLITGEAVVSDISFKKTFEQAAHSVNPLGGEMEGYGLGKECMFYNIPCMLIKSICDWGAAKNIDLEVKKATQVSKSKDKIQAYASYAAYTVLRKLFQERLFDESLYDTFKNSFMEKCESGGGCYIPYSNIRNEFFEYNDRNCSIENFKNVSEKYIDAFCKLMIEDGCFKERNTNEKGYQVLKRS